MKELKTMGIKTVINLRGYHSDNDEVLGTGLKQGRLHMEPWHAADDDVVGFLKLATDTNNLPVFVHCQRGADRTGMVCAMYRITVCGWTKEEAIRELKDGGFGFNPAWKNIVRYIEKADIEKIKKKAGLVEPLKR
jgi:protein tyrosine/serine phosphatase